MKILYAIQGTGNGHMSRAREIVPILTDYGQLDLMVSGTQCDVALNQSVKYNKYGFSYAIGKKGGIDILDTIKIFRPATLLKDILKFPVEDYDLIINDFEPVTAWACKVKKHPCVSFGHQSSFISPKAPRPAKKDVVGELVFKHYAPADQYIGLHFERYDDFVYSPVIRQEIRNTPVDNHGHITIYLPSYDDTTLIKHFQHFPDVPFHLFTRQCKTSGYRVENVLVRPINNDEYIKSLASSHGLLSGAGFEGPAEAMFFGKKVLAIPMVNQYEQLCNAEALKQLGVKVLDKVDDNFHVHLGEWLNNNLIIPVSYPDNARQLVETIIKMQLQKKAA
jgi:uncharacterized protein (TIGR00661 family)